MDEHILLWHKTLSTMTWNCQLIIGTGTVPESRLTANSSDEPKTAYTTQWNICNNNALCTQGGKLAKYLTPEPKGGFYRSLAQRRACLLYFESRINISFSRCEYVHRVSSTMLAEPQANRERERDVFISEIGDGRMQVGPGYGGKLNELIRTVWHVHGLNSYMEWSTSWLASITSWPNQLMKNA